MTRIRWTEEERLALSKEMTRLVTKHSYLSDADLVSLAQTNVLEKWRRRKMVGSALWLFKDAIQAARDAAVQAFLANGRSKPTQEPSAAPADPVVPIAAPEPALAISDLFERLVDAVAERVALRVLEALPAELGGSANRTEEQNRLRERAQIAAPDAPPRTGVLVVGLVGVQRTTIDAMFPDLSITHITAQEALAQATIRRAHTVMMTKFISHAAQDKYRKACNLHYCNGGVTDLASILKSISGSAQ